MSNPAGTQRFTHELVTSEVMQPQHANVAGNVHGGEIMKLMDTAAGAVAQRYSKGNCVTAHVDEIDFHLPVHVGALVTCTAVIVYVGRTSMEVYVDVEAENLASDNPPQRALSAFFTEVCLDSDGRPRPIVAYTPVTDDEKRLYLVVKERKEVRKKSMTYNKFRKTNS